MRDRTMLHPLLQEKINELLGLCCENGLKVGIGECLRTKKEQDDLYAKGRTAPGSIVTNAKGSTYSSMHQWGVAFDFYRNDGRGAFCDDDGFFRKVGTLGKSLGLIWGGDFKSPVDKPHFQLSDWGKTASVLKSLFKTPERFFESWVSEKMTESERKEFEKLKSEVEGLKKNAEKVYHTLDEIPDYAKETMGKLIEKGAYVGSGKDDLNLPENLMRVLVINERCGLYNE